MVTCESCDSEDIEHGTGYVNMESFGAVEVVLTICKECGHEEVHTV